MLVPHRSHFSKVTAMEIVYFLIFGAVAGWIAGLISKGGGFGLIGNIIVGILGAVIGGMLADAFDIATGSLLAQLAMAVVGALVLLFLLNFIVPKR